MSAKKKETKFTVTIEAAGTDGTKQSKKVQLDKPCTVKELLDLFGYAYDKHDVFLNGSPAKLNERIGGAKEMTVALKKQRKREPKETVEVRERPQGS